jgi:hypothetical protein
MIDPQLMSCFKFDQDDLYANQNGSFTEKQRLRLTQEDKSSRKSGLIWGGILLAMELAGSLAPSPAGSVTPIGASA